MAVSFSTALQAGESGTTTGIEVPAEVMSQLGPAKRYPVIVTIGAYRFRNSVSWYKGAFMISVSSEHRAASGLSTGDAIDVTLEHDTEPRTVEIPAELLEVLTSAGVLAKFTALSASKQRALVQPIVAAKTTETRDRNIAKVVAALAD